MFNDVEGFVTIQISGTIQQKSNGFNSKNKYIINNRIMFRRLIGHSIGEIISVSRDHV